ncbi:polar amino acid transport system substrate-binding protein [Inhella inkyongensis]|uniref:Polar amino acid transport system substrate-binding protein n=1 Tax=Inhella inkyongensis TaxID=392593 RepID=A0A840S7Z0_9BURK|nr:transporter substrate-binding domain-containing protein [Inhella inkyongensis]MBB5204560.1 polar amino acid transport system substrate-binding protein [Inhella inkyongensis]
MLRILLLALAISWPAVQAETLRVCLNDVGHPPWRDSDAQGKAKRSGLDFVFLKLLGERSGVRIDVDLLPWKRCLADVKSGNQDAILGISYLLEREELGHYPQLSGQPDPSLAVRFDRYAWYAAADSGIHWDGKILHGVTAETLVGVPSGYSIAVQVKQLGLKVDDAARTSQANLEKLARGRVQLAALQAREADQLLAMSPKLAQQVRRLEPLFQDRAYYMLFSRLFVARSQRPLPLWWREVVAVRDSAEYRRAESAALKALEDAIKD